MINTAKITTAWEKVGGKTDEKNEWNNQEGFLNSLPWKKANI